MRRKQSYRMNKRGNTGSCVHTGFSAPDLAVCPVVSHKWKKLDPNIFTVSFYSKLSQVEVGTRGAFIEYSAIKQKGPKDDLQTVNPGDKPEGEGNVPSAVAVTDIAALRDCHPDNSGGRV